MLTKTILFGQALNRIQEKQFHNLVENQCKARQVIPEVTELNPYFLYEIPGFDTLLPRLPKDATGKKAKKYLTKLRDYVDSFVIVNRQIKRDLGSPERAMPPATTQPDITSRLNKRRKIKQQLKKQPGTRTWSNW
jgi:hypothetical protein